MLKQDDIVELIYDLNYYKKGRKAVVIGKSQTDEDFIEVMFLGEDRIAPDIENLPIKYFKKCSST